MASAATVVKDDLQGEKVAKPSSFRCSYDGCGKAFTRRSILAKHEQRHAALRLREGFRTRFQLSEHELVHILKLSYTCSHEGCGKAFLRAQELIVHERPFREWPCSCSSTCHACG
mmetsp:Transcript_7012/g.23955  ORF Transcript_7012/g.23955 Transcript_7012/m.23955 type:complete len:115 (-) Transcript_7012:234-578(-)